MRARLAAILLAVAAISYSAWAIEIFLPARVSILHAYVSEYSAAGQPYRDLFRTTDMIAGACLIVAAFLVRQVISRSWLLTAGLAVLGVVVIADAGFTLDCASSLSAACRAKAEEGAVSFEDHMHIVTSVSSNLAMLVALFGAERLADRKTLPRLGIVLIVLTGLGIVVLDPLGPGHYAGAVLRVQLVAVGVALLIGAWRLNPRVDENSTPAPKP
jgi:hypothetical protein